jgi:hypothetical protein
MPLIRGSMITYTAGNDKCYDIATDGTYFYAGADVVPGRVIKSTISPLAQSAVATLSKDNTLGCTVLGGFTFTTQYPAGITIPGAGLVVKTNTTTMIEDSFTQLWSPGATSKRNTVAIYNDGTYIYVGSNSYDPGTGWLATKVTQMDTSFGSQTDVSLPTMGSTIIPSSVDGDGNHVYFGIGRGPTPDPTDSVVKLSTSGFAYVSKWNAPTGIDITDIICIPPKLYVGSAQGGIYRINTADMTLDAVIANQIGGTGAMLFANGLLYVNSLSNGNLIAYDLSTNDRIGSIQITATSGGVGNSATLGLFGPNTNGTVLYYGLYGSSPGGIQQLKNVYTGPTSSTYPITQQPTVASGGSAGPATPVIPSTSKDVSIRTGQSGAGANGFSGGGGNTPGGSTTGITSTNSVLQALAAGDPHFYGFEGENWFFNGGVGGYYNLFSDEGIQINSLFRYWETSNANNFTAMEEIGITIVIDKIHKIKNSKKKLFKKNGEVIKIKITANQGVSVNNELVCDSLDPILDFVEDLHGYFTDEELEKFRQTEGYGELMKANIIRFWPYNFIITRSTDRVNAPYLNIIVRLDGNTINRPHGVIGQTADFDGKPKEKIDGEEADYKVSDLWASDFKFNKFRR